VNGRRALERFLLCAFAVFVAGCSSGGSAGAPLAASGDSPAAAATTSLQFGSTPSEIHVVVEDSVAVGLLVAPLGALLPPGFVTRPLPFGRVQYPDGSMQVADVQGVFDPAASAYAVARADMLANDAEAAPYVIISDPADAIAPLYMQIEAARVIQSVTPTVLPQNSYAHILGNVGVNIASLGVRPRTQKTLDGATTVLQATAVDTDGHAVSPANGTIVWNVAGSGTILPLAQTAYALYTAPRSGSGIDRITATMTPDSTKPSFSAGSAIAFIDRVSLVRVAGTLARANAPVARGTMAFYQRAGLPAHFHPFYWFAAVFGGAFVASLPPSAALVPLARIPGDPLSLALGPAGTPAYVSPPAQRPLRSVSFTLSPQAPTFVDSFEQPPPVAAYIHDAWYANRQPFARHIFDVDSGIAPLLAQPGIPASGIVANGTFRHWHYAWQSGGDPALILIAASGTGLPGREAIVVKHGASDAAGRYTFERYDAPTALSLAMPLVAKQPGAVVQTTGTWTQSGSYAGDFGASVSERIYSTSNQNFAAPTYVETFAYTHSANGSERLQSDTLANAAGVKQWNAGTHLCFRSFVNALLPSCRVDDRSAFCTARQCQWRRQRLAFVSEHRDRRHNGIRSCSQRFKRRSRNQWHHRDGRRTTERDVPHYEKSNRGSDRRSRFPKGRPRNVHRISTLAADGCGGNLDVAGLTKRFDRKTVVSELTFSLARGEVLGLLGPNGAGKTTTFLCLCGLLRPDAGTIAYAGKRLGGGRGQTISLIPETPDVYAMLTVWEHLAFVARSVGLPRGWEVRANSLLERFGIAAERDTLGQALSKGLRQKTLIAATVLADAPVLLFDEPMIGLDPRGQRELRELIRSLSASGTSIVMSTHLIESAETICDRLIIMKGGVAIAAGAVAELRSRATGSKTLEDVFLDITA